MTKEDKKARQDEKRRAFHETIIADLVEMATLVDAIDSDRMQQVSDREREMIRIELNALASISCDFQKRIYYRNLAKRFA